MSAPTKKNPWGMFAERRAICGTDKWDFSALFTTTASMADCLAPGGDLSKPAPGMLVIGAMSHHSFVIFNKGVTNSLNYRVRGRLTLNALTITGVATQIITIIPSTSLAASTDTGIIALDPALMMVTIEVQNGAGSTTGELQYSAWC